uniref:ribonuclease H n=1 Tax=Astyanax mexicanus TaxID=7994 RepID=A0A3B1JXQ2_ASTMX
DKTSKKLQVKYSGPYPILNGPIEDERSKRAMDLPTVREDQKQNQLTVIEDKDEELLTEKAAVMERWTEYCKELYNFPIKPDNTLLKKEQDTREVARLPVLKEEVRHAVKRLKTGKSPGPDNIPAELLKNGGEDTISILTSMCQKIWESKEWPEEWTKSLIILLPKKGNPRHCQNHRTISLISHPSKVMLRVILDRLTSQAEEILAEEQAGFRKGRSTVEQVFNCRVLIEKHIAHQKELYHNFIDFKKAFDRVWHEGLWQVLRDFSIEEGVVQMIQTLYHNASSAVLLNSQVGEFFRTTVGVRQGCLLSPVLFNLYLENIMREALEGHQTSISIGGRPVCNLHFADDIDLMGGSNQELQSLTDKLAGRAGAYGMEVSTDKSKVMVNSINNICSANITMNGQQLDEVDTFKYLGSILSQDGRCTAEIKIRITITTSAMAGLRKTWQSKELSFNTKLKLIKSPWSCQSSCMDAKAGL